MQVIRFSHLLFVKQEEQNKKNWVEKCKQGRENIRAQLPLEAPARERRHGPITALSAGTRPIVINKPTRELLVGETKNFFDKCLDI